MSRIISIFTKIIDLCRRVPLLPIVILAAIPLIVCPTWRPWGQLDWPVNPGVGQWIVIALVVYTIIDTVRGMIDDIRHGQVGVDLLAVVAIASTVAVQEYWAAWAVTLMISSGEAIEEYAQGKAESNLTALMQAAPQIAHIATLPGVGAGAGAGDGRVVTSEASGESGQSGDAEQSGKADDGFRPVASAAAARTKANHNSQSSAHFRTVPVDEVALGDVLIVLPGETVPVDGELLSGSATLDLSNINGEPVPREVFAGARVMSGAVNGSTTLTMRATEVAKDSQYQRILELVASAQESRPAVVKTADRLAVPFTILAFIIAGVAWAVSGTPLRFAQVLVLATPCPLLIAAPVAYVAGTGRLAKAGILIKAQDVLENLGRVNHVFFDKTGTLTVKQPQVVRVDRPLGNTALGNATLSNTALDNSALGNGGPASASTAAQQRPQTLNDDHVLMMAGVVESYSVHILSKGIAAAGLEAMNRLNGRYAAGQRQCPERDMPGHGRDYPVVKNIVEDAGKGVSGEVNGHVVRVGRLAFASARADGFQPVVPAGGAAVSAVGDTTATAAANTVSGVTTGAKAATNGETTVPRVRFAPLAADEMATYVSIDGVLVARIVLRDVPRNNVQSALAWLHKLGVGELTMLTGDKAASAAVIAQEVGIDEVHAELFPEDKVAAVREATVRDSKAVTMMVGDGVNDAPVLAAATIGMAITDGTSTAASQSAQVVIMNDDIACVPRAIAIARRTKTVMLQAVLLGLGLALIGMIAAAFNLIPVVVGAFLQEAIDVVSILWSLMALVDKESQ
ncbi:HAD-IC family P-type ATPase [Bifidobacterium oedipodis]|uniref:Zinc-transporting ATPase n=1 Tax=Bifidobacterium oedipodis TaxID=2675322 RepID=A0A7Y0EQQ2_9BIFI|nr:HAD-IC family P-type ATPase [Bifidobacterium sp. DSM 109957]NMM94703.1 zinc-transporting ATPase [Bifidobacterium sp. DSM 109957]